MNEYSPADLGKLILQQARNFTHGNVEEINRTAAWAQDNLPDEAWETFNVVHEGLANDRHDAKGAR